MYGLPDSSAPATVPPHAPAPDVAPPVNIEMAHGATHGAIDIVPMQDVVAAVGSAPGLLAWPLERIAGAPLAYYALTLGMMLLLAGLDAVGAVFAKEWSMRQQPLLFIAGLLCFVLLYVVFAHSLHIAELSIVTLGWIVFLQVGLLLLDALRYGVSYSLSKWVAIAIVIGLQGYIVLAPNPK